MFTGLPAYQSFGRSRNYCGVLRIEVVDEPKPLQHQPLIHELDHGRLGRDQAGQPAGRNHPGVFSELFLDPRHHAFDLGGEGEDDPGLHAFRGRPADHVRRRLELDPLQPGRSLVERVDRNPHSGRDRTPEVIALFGDDVVGRGRAEVDDDQRPAVLLEGGHRRHDAVGADLLGIAIVDLRSVLDPGADHHRLFAEIAFDRLDQAAVQGRDHAGHHHRLDAFGVDPLLLNQLHHQQAELIGHAVAPGREAPVVPQLVSLEEPERQVRVPEVDRQQHRRQSTRAERRLWFLQWDVATASWNAAAEEMRKLRPFWRDGGIVQWPARESRRRLVLAEVARAFPPGKRLAETEVDAMLREFWPDHCQLRRALVERELLNRKDGVYWRVG